MKGRTNLRLGLTSRLGSGTRRRIINDMRRAIISEGEALRILKNDLRRFALEKHAAELKKAAPKGKLEIMAKIDRDIQKELRKRSIRIEPDMLLH